MAVCTDCGLEMEDKVSCTTERFVLADGSYERVRVPSRPPRNCGDCYAPPRGFHHPGCDTERCPRCRRQLITCGCWEDLV